MMRSPKRTRERTPTDRVLGWVFLAVLAYLGWLALQGELLDTLTRFAYWIRDLFV